MDSIFQTFIEVLLRPTRFFRQLETPKVGIQRPFRFALIFMTIKVLLIIAFFIFPQRIYPHTLFGFNAFFACFWLLLGGVIWHLFYLHISAILLHRIARFFSNIDSFPSAYGILAYNLAATAPFGIVFGVGYLYGVYLLYVGLRERYHLSLIEAVITWFLAFFLINIIVAFVFMGFMFIINMLQISIF